MPKQTGRPRGHTPDGPKLRQLRIDRGLTAMQLGTQIGCDPESVRRAERGGRIGAVLASRIARALGVKVEDIASPPGDDIGSDAETKIPA